MKKLLLDEEKSTDSNSEPATDSYEPATDSSREPEPESGCKSSSEEETEPLLAKSVPEPEVASLWSSAAFFVAATCTCMFVCTTLYACEMGKVDWSGAWYGVVILIFLQFVNMGIAGSMYCVYRLLGFTPDDITIFKGSRDKWTLEMVNSFHDKYGERRVKIIDAVNRRAGHILGSVKWTFIIPLWIPTQKQRVAAMIVYTALRVIIKVVCLSSDHPYVSRVLFNSARIRDGRLARLNLTLVHFVGLGFYPLIGIIILNSSILPMHTGYIMAYCWQCLIWGDTMAEMIGSFLGRFEFEVKGAGDINKKTVEGVVACWLASLCACAGYVALSPGFPVDHFQVHMSLVHMAAATVATIAETAAPRSTDNGFMVLSSALVVIYLYVPVPLGRLTTVVANAAFLSYP